MAVGLSGIDACLVEAEPMSEELGAVGRPARADAALLDLLASNGYVPVVACVAGDRSGRMYNVNADQMAAALAAAYGADRVVFLTDVAGVLRDGQVLPTLGVADCEALIRDGVATGGMHAKLAAATEALEKGVREIIVAPGVKPGLVTRALAGESVGTKLLAEVRADDRKY
jgi:acetylglutamate kinase